MIYIVGIPGYFIKFHGGLILYVQAVKHSLRFKQIYSLPGLRKTSPYLLRVSEKYGQIFSMGTHTKF